LIKRGFDIFFSALGLVICSPIFLVLLIAIRLESRGPVFYRGVRVGLHGKPFRIYKFRSMVTDAEKLGASSTHQADPRLTRCGKFIRKYKLDELSQLVNVFLGDMGFVGPRPEVQKFVDIYTEEEKQILSVRPGITDWSSIKFHNEAEIIEASGIANADEAYEKLIRPEKLRLQEIHQGTQSLGGHQIVVSTVLTLFSTRFGGKPVGVPEL
jgi:lipopolysaccharide/colanic/teichoic acid biosynthesis glycosyltransferase